MKWDWAPPNFITKMFQVLIISYETFRMHASRFEKEGSCDLLICDEAHRLKNDKTLTNQVLNRSNGSLDGCHDVNFY